MNKSLARRRRHGPVVLEECRCCSEVYSLQKCVCSGWRVCVVLDEFWLKRMCVYCLSVYRWVCWLFERLQMSEESSARNQRLFKNFRMIWLAETFSLLLKIESPHSVRTKNNSHSPRIIIIINILDYTGTSCRSDVRLQFVLRLSWPQAKLCLSLIHI